MPHTVTHTSATTEPRRFPSLADVLQPQMPQAVAQPDVTGMVQPPPAEISLQLTGGGAVPIRPRTMVQVQEAIGHVRRDPLGTVVGMVKGVLEDAWTVMAVMPEELEDPEIQKRLGLITGPNGIGNFLPELLKPLAEINQMLVDEGIVSDPRGRRFGAGARISALAVSSGAAGAAGGIIGRTTTFTGRVGAGVVEGIAFGTTFGALTPLEEGQTRAGNIITSLFFAVPLATLGGVTSLGVQRFLSRRNINPKLEAPEITPLERGFNSRAEVRANGAFIESEAAALRRIGERARAEAGGIRLRRLPEEPIAEGAMRPPPDVTAATFEIAGPTGPLGTARVGFNRRTNTLTVFRADALEGAGAIGPRAVREVQRELFRRFPDAETISGLRVTGARAGQMRVMEVARSQAMRDLEDPLGASIAKSSVLAEQGRMSEAAAALKKGVAAKEAELAAPPAGAGANRRNLPPGGSDIIDKLSIGQKPPRRPFSWDDFYTRYIDDLHPINVATKELLLLAGRDRPLRPGQRLPPINDPYVLARLARGSTGKSTSFLESGPLDWKTLQPVGPGLRQILRPIVETSEVDALRALLVSRRAIELEGRGIKTPFDLAAAKSVTENSSPRVQAVAQQVVEYQATVLKYLEDSGMLSAEQVRLMRDANQAYVPFYRFVEGDIGPAAPAGGPPVGGKRFANLVSGLRRIKGSERPGVIDPLESIVRNTYAMVQLADRQAVSNALVRLAEQVPDQTIVRRVSPPVKPTNIGPELTHAFKEAGVELPAEVLDNLSLTFRPRDRLPPGTFWVNRQGQRQFFEADAPLYEALLDLGREQTPQVISLLSVPARTLRAGATLSPGFIARNPFRDQFWAAVSSKYGFVPVVDLGRGIFQMAERGRLYEQFRRSGAEHASLVRTTRAERASLQRNLNDLLTKESLLADTFRTARGPKGWLEGLRVLSETMENASRSQEFVRALAHEGDPRMAAFAAREVTLDFARVGTQVRVMNQIIPFFNASVQSIDKAARVFRDNPTRATALAVGYITLPTMALYFLNHDDENYNELSEARRDYFWNFPQWRFNEEEGRLEKTGGFISVPKPFELGLVFGSYPERVLRYLKDNDPEAFDQLAQNTLSAFTPSVLPTAVSVPIEAVTGFSFFQRRSIVPEREQRLLPAEQAGPLQGETVRLIGKALDVSPRIVQNTVRGFTGGLGEGALATSDLILEAVGVQLGPTETRTPAERVPLIGPLVSQFLVREPTLSSKSVEKYYRNWEQVEGTMNTVRALIREGRGTDAAGLAKVNRVEMVSYPVMLEASQAIGKLRNAIRLVRANRTLSREEREERMLLLGRAVRTFARNANDAYRIARQKLEEREAQGQMRSTPGQFERPQPTSLEGVEQRLPRLEDVLRRQRPR